MMTEQDRRLAATLTRAMPDDAGEASFAQTWEAAERRAGSVNRRWQMAVAAAVAMIALVIGIDVSKPPELAPEYLELTELLDSTYWSAPSDALLSNGRVDVYQDVPDLLESTDIYGGALL